MQRSRLSYIPLIWVKIGTTFQKNKFTVGKQMSSNFHILSSGNFTSKETIGNEQCMCLKEC